MNTTAPPLGIPPGLFRATSYDSVSLRLEPGDSVLFCTDGITDAFDCEGEQFGIERLQGLCDAGPRLRQANCGDTCSRPSRISPVAANSMTIGCGPFSLW